MGTDKNQPQDEATIKLIELQRKAAAYDALYTEDHIAISKTEYDELHQVFAKYTLHDLENNVLVPRDQFSQLAAVIKEYKADIIDLVTVFNNIKGMMGSNINPLKIIKMIPKLMADESLKVSFEKIAPIIDKYTDHGQEK